MSVKIIENVLPKDTNIKIIHELCNINWNIAADITGNQNKFEKIFSEKNSGFVFVSLRDGKVINNETLLNFYGFIIFDILKEKLKINGVIDRFFWNMYLKGSEGEYHTDSKNKNFKSILYSLHTTDGGIKIEDDFFQDKMGEAKIFNSNLMHKGFGPKKDNVRFNLNIVYKEIINE